MRDRAFIIAATILSADARPSSAQAPQDSARDVAAWVSAGIGGGTIQGIGGALREVVSVGPVVLMARQADIGPFFSGGKGVRDRGVLLGGRSAGQRLFASAAAGYSRANSYSQVGEGGRPDLAHSEAALGYDLSLHANAVIAGLALGLSGELGRSNVTYSMITVSLEVGWFGMRPGSASPPY